MNTLQLAKANPEAFSALPEPYQADDCLLFFTKEDKLHCVPNMENQWALGCWEAVYDADLHEWVSVQ